MTSDGTTTSESESLDQRGRIAVVTGANSGLGREATTRLTAAGARVILAVRDEAKGRAAAAAIRASHDRAEVEVRHLDLADLASVEAFAASLGADLSHLDLLVNNAGVMAVPTRFETADGHELQWGTNFLGPFALTMQLLPLLLASPAPRVATMSSIVAGWGRIRFDDLDSERGYRSARAYAQSKLADLYLAQQLGRLADERGWNLVSTAAHPGYTRTNLQSAGSSLGREKPKRSVLNTLPLVPSMEPVEGAGPILFAAMSPGVVQGGYYGPAGTFSLVGAPGPARLTRRMRDETTAARVWSVAEQVTGTAPPRRSAPSAP